MSDDDFLDKLQTPEGCEQFALNVEARKPLAAAAARAKRFRLLAGRHDDATTEVVVQGIQAVYAYEGALSRTRKKKVRASRTWQKIDRVGVVQTLEDVVKRKKETEAFRTLASMDLLEFSFEAVVLRHPDNFSTDAIARARERLNSVTPRPDDTPAPT